MNRLAAPTIVGGQGPCGDHINRGGESNDRKNCCCEDKELFPVGLRSLDILLGKCTMIGGIVRLLKIVGGQIDVSLSSEEALIWRRRTTTCDPSCADLNI
jgi:hypothetical protein